MLHKITFPSCIEQMEVIITFQRKVLAFACNPRTLLSNEEQVIESQVHAEFGTKIGTWICKKLWIEKRNRSKELSSLHKSLVKLIKCTKSNPTLSLIVMDAFDNDIQFCNCLKKQNFEFWYKTRLNEPLKEAIRGLL